MVQSGAFWIVFEVYKLLQCVKFDEDRRWIMEHKWTNKTNRQTNATGQPANNNNNNPCPLRTPFPFSLPFFTATGSEGAFKLPQRVPAGPSR